ncbi:hypothetical protein GCM10028778_12450 [Barrientosiimonas marina]|uniref:S-layer homology domain-containing protein n=1 Tax=Lentibacillus kimchii TaxID=1542911 RepID=A0ABW2UWZ9_9BACI
MKKQGSFMAALAVTASLAFPAATVGASGDTSFKDVDKDDPAADVIYHYVDEGVINGYEDGTFRKFDDLTRKQAAVILTEALDLDVPESSSVTKYFDDVQADDGNADKIAAVAKEGIMTGDDDHFKPFEKLTREQMATILVKGLDLTSEDNQADINLGNVSGSHKANVQVLGDLGITNQLEDFRPYENVKRVQMLNFLDHATDAQENNGDDIEGLLKKAYANEQDLDAYDMEGHANIGVDLPESAQTEAGDEAIAQLLDDIQVDFSGSFQQDPMAMDMTVDVTMQAGEGVEQTVSLPMVMTEDKMWMKQPQPEGKELPEEIAGKYIEYDLEAAEGQMPAGSDINMKLGQDIQNMFIDYFAKDYYNQVEAGSYDFPDYVNENQVVKFNLNNENLQPFADTLLTGFLPEFLNVIEEEDYADELGLTEEDIQKAQEQMNDMQANIEDIKSEIDDTVDIKTFEQYTAINRDNFMQGNAMDLDLAITNEGETAGLNLSSEQTKQNINGDVTIEKPDQDETITEEEFNDIMEDQLPDEVPGAPGDVPDEVEDID